MKVITKEKILTTALLLSWKVGCCVEHGIRQICCLLEFVFQDFQTSLCTIKGNFLGPAYALAAASDSISGLSSLPMTKN